MFFKQKVYEFQIKGKVFEKEENFRELRKKGDYNSR